jgi:hypothetical protein
VTTTAPARTDDLDPPAQTQARPPVVAARPPTADPSPLWREFDSQVRALLLRISDAEQQATAAHQDAERVFSWPSWSMDTGLTEAQERFVEAWSPRRVLDSCRRQRRLIHELQGWTHSHPDDAGANEALTLLALLPIW